MDGERRGRSSSGQVEFPRMLVVAGGWAWRLIAIGLAAYGLVRVMALLWLVVVPVVAALLLAALLRPVSARLLRWRFPGPLAALVTLLLAVVVLGGIGFLVQQRVSAELTTLVDEVANTVRGLRPVLDRLGVGNVGLDQLGSSVVNWLEANRGQAFGLVQTGAGVVADVATMAVLTLFVCFFFLYDGGRLWRTLLIPFPGRIASRVDGAGRTAWAVITAYIHGTAMIATIHGVVIGLVVFLLGAPLAVPLGVLVFIGSFIPIAGALVSGGVAVLVTLGTKGWVAALILLAVLIVEDQLEAHLLQPVIVGRYVRLHPLLIGLSLAVGTVLGGIIGALVAVPVAAVLRHSVPVLLGRQPPEPARDGGAEDAAAEPAGGDGGGAEDAAAEPAGGDGGGAADAAAEPAREPAPDGEDASAAATGVRTQQEVRTQRDG